MELSGCHQARFSDSVPQGVYNTVQVNWGVHRAARRCSAAALTLDRNTGNGRRPTLPSHANEDNLPIKRNDYVIDNKVLSVTSFRFHVLRNRYCRIYTWIWQKKDAKRLRIYFLYWSYWAKCENAAWTWTQEPLHLVLVLLCFRFMEMPVRH